MPRLGPLICVICLGCVAEVDQFSLTGFVYSQNPAVYTRGQAITPNVPNAKGSSVRFSVSPLLAPGLSIDGASGVISGTPTEDTPSITYFVTATSDSRATTTAVSITVTEPVPNLVYAGAPFVFVIGEASSTGAPANLGGAFLSCSGTAPPGMKVEGDCTIDGFPTQVSAQTSDVVTVTYAAGTTTVPVLIAINATLSLSPPSISTPAQSGLTQTFTGQGGVAPYSYTVTSGAGSIDGQSGVFTATGDIGNTTVQVTDSNGRQATSIIRAIRTWVDGPVYAVGGSLGAIYVGGTFDRAGFFSAPGALALDATSGQPVLGFDVQNGFDDDVDCIVISGDDVYIGGKFAHYQGQVAQGLAKISLSTGQLDTTFDHTAGFINGAVTTLALAPDGLWVGGSFDTYRGQSVSPVVRLDVTGKIQAQGTTITSDSIVQTVLVSGTQVYVGGLLPTVLGGSTKHVIVRLNDDGSLDSGFNMPTGLVATAQALVLHGDAIYWTSAGSGGTLLSSVKESDGSALTVLAPKATSGFATVLLDGGDGVFVGGNFATSGGYNNLVKLDWDTGDTLQEFNQSGAFADSTYGVTALATTNGQLWVGGSFRTYLGKPANMIAVVDPMSGDPVLSLGNGFAPLNVTQAQSTGFVSAFGLSGNTVVVGVPVSGVSGFGGLLVNNIARFDLATSATPAGFDSTFAQSVGFADAVVSSAVRVSTIATDSGALFIGGTFDTFLGPSGTAPVGNIAKVAVSGFSFDSTFATNAQFTGGSVNIINAPGDGATIWVGGSFTSPQVALAKLNESDGTSASVSLGLTGTGAVVVNDIGVSNDPTHVPPIYDIIIGGSFTGSNASGCGAGTLGNIAAFDGSTGACLLATPAPYQQMIGTVNCITTEQGNALWGGDISGVSLPSTVFSGLSQTFGRANATSKFAFSVLSAQASLGLSEPSFTGPSGVTVYQTAGYVRGATQAMFVAGNFLAVNGMPQQGLARLNGIVPNATTTPVFYFDPTSSANLALDGAAYAVSLRNGIIYVGGTFNTFQGQRVYNFIGIDPDTGARLE